ncbi:hypothetical protein [Kitasatospora sp. NPDC087315]|uniref:hypothetical protein n=1 Tax=Kitasatospora sp. NPDC087315 TaxID=3364069 RepID=UPI003826B23D
MTTAPEPQTVRLDEQRFPCKYDGPSGFARVHVDGEGDIGLLVRSGDPNDTASSIYLNPEVAEALSLTLNDAATQSRTLAEEIRRVQAEEAEATKRLGELDAARQVEDARHAGSPYMVAGGSTSPAAVPPPTFADVMLPQTDTTAERERAFLRASELLGPDAGVAARIAMANYLLQGAQ